MIFDDIGSVMEFYKTYAHNVGFGVRLGQQKVVDNVLQWKRFLCAKEGFRTKKGMIAIDPAKKRRKVKLTRCGCEAYIYVTRESDGKYRIASLTEYHNHPFVPPSQQHLIRSNRQVSERVKTTLYDCQRASIGTALAYRFLHVDAGGFEHVGCTKKDLQNHYGVLKNKIKNCDAQMLVDQFGRLKALNPAFFYEYEVDDVGTLVRLFWADASSRKIYGHFNDVVSFDSTYNTNQYEYIFAPFTGVNHHMQSVFFGAGFLLHETTDSYAWLFTAFLRAMGGIAPRLIITDECLRMKNAIGKILRNTAHRLCMWHIMEKVPGKVHPELKNDLAFYDRLKHCVWNSETPAEFEDRWKSFITEFKLEDHEWFAKKYMLRATWIPAYFMNIPLAGLLRTTSISESANLFFKRFICRRLTFVEFWLRFDTALKCQRQNELIADNTSQYTTTELLTSWDIERQARALFTHEIFELFQAQVLAARDECDVQEMANGEGIKIISISDQYKKIREVCYDTKTMTAKCSCKLFESTGIICRHIIRVLRGAKINELPSSCVLKRWQKNCKRDIVLDGEGNVLEEKFIDQVDMAVKRKIAAVRNKLEDLIQNAKGSMEGIELLHTSLCNVELDLAQLVPDVACSTQENQESFIGSAIPKHVTILTPTDVNGRGTCSRIKGHRDGVKSGSGEKSRRPGIHQKVARKCNICKELVFHDAGTCSKKQTAQQ
ncbi:protein FAR1-RELATED SEQUENCE 5 [Triticum aestivum]|uniref:protein FAR1-RELATED SEQUENCE 5 n=1 Tax=Triticum aestivum TaxID=4565 RepID=UPI001D019FE0|nr:protein FAR1-RELATED SEQUENCE 5-like [Triticum aestivum]XP_044376456.1 protein FAR1-RELATED SEQUENCE 5-like [Triticum aestivum]XP_044376457.1 protein FAR1-RELATED SEQUENCE 5-like [Triticum aestivum]XP_044376458.1 protein FAR1-RELATED SEQUENCE 5-like [Triticum aestivum]XP_044376459.1 protein FAR1-RELATED SEQUENCE 5-like [Triticum aestivum]XP_044376460.1 protein FAR1-RELATED SEQUENCE 5-like [Triticum aestivum]XP_044376461.1 protein FAR1-RELATED SEQUENCE 5-like [Triticum aestivum]XP_04437646